VTLDYETVALRSGHCMSETQSKQHQRRQMVRKMEEEVFWS